MRANHFCVHPYTFEPSKDDRGISRMAGYLNLVVSVPVFFDEGPEAPSVIAFGSAIVTQSRVMEPAPKVGKYGNLIGQ